MSPENNDWKLSKTNVDTVIESMFIANSDGKVCMARQVPAELMI